MGSREDLDRVALAELHDRLLPAGPRAAVHAAALRLRLHHRDVDALDLDIEQLLDGLADLRLVGVGVDAEAVLPLVDRAVGLFRHDGREQDLVRMQAHLSPFAFGSAIAALPCTASSAPCVTSRERAHTTAATSSSLGAQTTAASRVRKDLVTFSSSSVATISTGASWPHDASRSAALPVAGASKPEPSRTPNVPFEAWDESAPRSADRRPFRFTLTSKFRPPVGNATP